MFLSGEQRGVGIIPAIIPMLGPITGLNVGGMFGGSMSSLFGGKKKKEFEGPLPGQSTVWDFESALSEVQNLQSKLLTNISGTLDPSEMQSLLRAKDQLDAVEGKLRDTGRPQSYQESTGTMDQARGALSNAQNALMAAEQTTYTTPSLPTIQEASLTLDSRTVSALGSNPSMIFQNPALLAFVLSSPQTVQMLLTSMQQGSRRPGLVGLSETIPGLGDAPLIGQSSEQKSMQTTSTAATASPTTTINMGSNFLSPQSAPFVVILGGLAAMVGLAWAFNR